MPKSSRGGQRSGRVTKSKDEREFDKTYAAEEKRIDDVLSAPEKRGLGEYDTIASTTIGESEVQLNRYSIASMVKQIKDMNIGGVLMTPDENGALAIKYKDGSMGYYTDGDSFKSVKLTGIQAVIGDYGYGYDVAGKGIVAEDYSKFWRENERKRNKPVTEWTTDWRFDFA